jgi:hypothetical protein
MKVTAHTKEELIRKFIEKLDYSYNYKTVNERQSIINDICEIAGIEQLNIPVVVGQKGRGKLYRVPNKLNLIQ